MNHWRENVTIHWIMIIKTTYGEKGLQIHIKRRHDLSRTGTVLGKGVVFFLQQQRSR